MSRPASKHPTELELQILTVLWREGALSGRQIRDALEPDRKLTYPSVMTMLGIMEDKGYVRRKKERGSYVYSARIKQEANSRRMLSDLVERVFDGSAVTAMVNLLESAEIDDEELKQLRRLLKKKTQP